MTERRVRIKLPIPLDVSGNLLKALGAMYPDSVIRTDDPFSGGHMVVDVGTRTARSSKRRMADEMDETCDATLNAITEDGVSIGTPEGAMMHLAEWALTVLEAHEATNYVEQAVHLTDTGRTILVTACWSKGQTPHDLRLAADARANAAEARIAELEAQLAAKT